jgi:hypothetical protein
MATETMENEVNTVIMYVPKKLQIKVYKSNGRYELLSAFATSSSQQTFKKMVPLSVYCYNYNATPCKNLPLKL